MKVDQRLIDLIKDEGWEIEKGHIWAYGEKFPLVDPLKIHFKVYRTNLNPDTRYDAFKRIYETIWPQKIITYNYWMERFFREHCNSENKIIMLAAGGGCGKTQMASEAAAIFWLSYPHKNAVITASTTLDSLRSRIFGYVERSLKEMVIPFPYIKENSPPPKIHPPEKDYIHGIYAVAANRGDDEESIKNWLGRHPKHALMLILDECTDLPVAVAKAKSNLEKGLAGGFQIIGIGNSSNTDNLHGLMCTPKVGWDNIDPSHSKWETTQPNGICLYFNPYESPAIHETEPTKKEALSKFMLTEESLKKAEQEEGVDSESFWRFTMGFWKRATKGDDKIISEAFLKEYNCQAPAHFSGMKELKVAAGLDPAFSVGGDKCILRFAIMGIDVRGKVVLDFRNTDLLFNIIIKANTGKSAEIQIADEVINLCGRFGVSLNTLCIDASGQGRGLADIIQLRSNGTLTPTKIYSTNPSHSHKRNIDMHITSSYDMWFKGREFITNNQIYGLDNFAYQQLHSRLIMEKAGKKILEKKSDYKKRMTAISSLLGSSPDEADAAMLTIQSAIIHHGFGVGQSVPIQSFQDEVSRKYFMTLNKMKNEAMENKGRLFIPKPSYTKGIESLIGKKYF